MSGVARRGWRAQTIYEKPLPARLVLARAMGLSTDEAGVALAALIEGGYGIAPRLPTNGMLAAYMEATEPPRGHESVITSIGKARARWQAMLEQGTAMAMSYKRVHASGIETRSAIDSEAGVARKGESPTAASGDAQT